VVEGEADQLQASCGAESDLIRLKKLSE